MRNSSFSHHPADTGLSACGPRLPVWFAPHLGHTGTLAARESRHFSWRPWLGDLRQKRTSQACGCAKNAGEVLTMSAWHVTVFA